MFEYVPSNMHNCGNEPDGWPPLELTDELRANQRAAFEAAQVSVWVKQLTASKDALGSTLDLHGLNNQEPPKPYVCALTIIAGRCALLAITKNEAGIVSLRPKLRLV